MSDITDYERRISAALARLERGMEALAGRAAPIGSASADADSVSAAEVTALRAALEGERLANAQLSDRVRAIREKQESTLGSLERKLATLSRDLEKSGSDLARLKRANADLILANRALRDAAELGLAPSETINHAMKAELEALQAERVAEIAEVDDILAGLEPLLAPAQATETSDA
jgi:hypothetical protein